MCFKKINLRPQILEFIFQIVDKNGEKTRILLKR